MYYSTSRLALGVPLIYHPPRADSTTLLSSPGPLLTSLLLLWDLVRARTALMTLEMLRSSPEVRNPLGNRANTQHHHFEVFSPRNYLFFQFYVDNRIHTGKIFLKENER